MDCLPQLANLQEMHERQHCLQELDGIRNSHIDKFLPPKRTEDKSGRRELSFVFDPIVDLNLPNRDQ